MKWFFGSFGETEHAKAHKARGEFEDDVEDEEADEEKHHVDLLSVTENELEGVKAKNVNQCDNDSHRDFLDQSESFHKARREKVKFATVIEGEDTEGEHNDQTADYLENLKELQVEDQHHD